MTKSQAERLFCNECRQHTKHRTISSHRRRYTPEDTPGMEIDFAECTCDLLECCGCGEVTFRETWVNSENWVDETGELVRHATLYPPRRVDFVRRYFRSIPPALDRIYVEIIDAYASSLYTLCAAGVRALLEGICDDQGIRSGYVLSPGGKRVRSRKLHGKISGMAQGGLLTKQHADALHELRFLGNDALHELRQPHRTALKGAIEILEHTLENLYDLKGKAGEVRTWR